MSMNSPVRIEGKLEEPHKRETLMGAAVHIISIFSPLWGPLIAWALFRNSLRFVAAHAWSALVEFILLKAALLVAGGISLGFTIASLIHHSQTNWKDFSWAPIITKVVITCLILLILGGITTILSLRQALLAYNGHWPPRDVKKAQRAERQALAES
jgi:uncharacterized Tic20 family protein